VGTQTKGATPSLTLGACQFPYSHQTERKVRKYGRTAVHHIFRASLACRKDFDRHSWAPCPRENTHLPLPRAIFALEWGYYRSLFPWRLQEENNRPRKGPTRRLLQPWSVQPRACQLSKSRDLTCTHVGPMSNPTAELRNAVRSKCERDILDFFEHAGQVAIYDANNGTKESRKKLYDRFHPLGYHVIFLGSLV